MNTNEEIWEELKKKYTPKELAEKVMISQEISEEARTEFVRLRMELREKMTPEQKLWSELLSIKYSIEFALKTKEIPPDKTFIKFLKHYLEVTQKNQKELAEDINIHPSRINRILKGKEKIGKSIAYRLEAHSGELIPAIYWWKLMQKEVEEEIRTNTVEREKERKHVKKVVYRASSNDSNTSFEKLST